MEVTSTHSLTSEHEKRQLDAAKEQIALAAAGSHTAAHTATAGGSNHSSASVGGSNRRPFIVATVVLPNGVKEVPRRFEQCEVEELVALIGGPCSLVQ